MAAEAVFTGRVPTRRLARPEVVAQAGAQAQTERAALGGWPTVFGILVTAGMVALPMGIPLSEVLARWVPALHDASLALPVTGTIWAGMAAWLLQGVRAHLRHAAAPLR